MEIDPVLIIVVAGSVGGLWIERFFYYRAKYKKRNNNPNPSPDAEEPGEAEMCLEHDRKLTEVVNDVKWIKKALNKKK